MQAIVLGLLINLLAAQTPGAHKSDRERAGFTGNVRSVLMEVATVSRDGDRMVEGKRFGTWVTRYDERGNLTEMVLYDGSRVLSRTVYAYDADGSYTIKRYNAERTSSDNAAGNPPTPSPRVSHCAVKYDSDGNLVEETCVDADNKGQERTEYRFDKANHRLETIKSAADGKGRSHCVETMDEHGQTVAEECENNEPKAIATRTKATYSYEFDAQGNWIKRYGSAWQGNKEKMTFIGKDVVYRTISYDAAKDVHPDNGAKIVDVLPPGPMIIRKSGGVLQQSAIRRAEPRFPMGAPAGTVVVEITVDEKGKVIAARAISGPHELRGVSEEAARGWEFKPTTLSGVPVKVIGTITFNYNR
jgi:hypothetical protein